MLSPSSSRTRINPLTFVFSWFFPPTSQLVAIDAAQIDQLDAKTLQELLDGEPGEPV